MSYGLFLKVYAGVGYFSTFDRILNFIDARNVENSISNTVLDDTMDRLMNSTSSRAVTSFYRLIDTFGERAVNVVKSLDQNKLKDFISQGNDDIKASLNEMFGFDVNVNTYENEWHLSNGEGHGLGISSAWQDGYTGKGITFGLDESGIQISHPDLVQNHDSTLGYQGADELSHRHGTLVAGVIAASNNQQGSTGIAYDSTYGLLKSEVTVGENTYAPKDYSIVKDFDVVNMSNTASQGSTANFYNIDGDVQNTTEYNIYQDMVEGLNDAAIYGRAGLGTILVGGAGNGKHVWGSVQNRARSNMPEFISVAASRKDDSSDEGHTLSPYSQPGASVFVQL
jgi:hypothetical protein